MHYSENYMELGKIPKKSVRILTSELDVILQWSPSRHAHFRNNREQPLRANRQRAVALLGRQLKFSHKACFVYLRISNQLVKISKLFLLTRLRAQNGLSANESERIDIYSSALIG